MSITPLRVGFSPTSVITISEPKSDAPAASQNAAAEMSPGTARWRPVSRWPPGHRDRARPQPLHLHAELGQRALRMVPCGERFGHRGPAGRMKARQQHGALDLRARNLGLVIQRGQRRRAMHRQRRTAVAGLDARAHPLQRHDHAAHGTALQRRRRRPAWPQTGAPPGSPPACASCCPNCRRPAARPARPGRRARAPECEGSAPWHRAPARRSRRPAAAGTRASSAQSPPVE